MDSNELEQLFSFDGFNEFDMGKYTVKVLSGSDRLYQIKTDRSARLMHTMANYREKKLFCDVTLCVKGQRFLAHKIVLASTSAYFASMFGRNYHIEANTTRDIDLTELVLCPEAMNIILDFLYTSQIQLNDRCVLKLKIEFLFEICFSFPFDIRL